MVETKTINFSLTFLIVVVSLISLRWLFNLDWKWYYLYIVKLCG